MTIYDGSVREAACGLFERGLGYEFAARRLRIPPEAVKKWHCTYRAVGRDALLDMGSDLEAYIHHWNNVRHQVKLKGLTPVEFWEQALREAG